MHGAVFLPCCLTWDQTMVGVMKIMATSFKRSCASTVVFNPPDPAMGHCRPTPPSETPGHSQARLGQSFVGPLLLSPGSWREQGFVSAFQESVSSVLCKFCNQIPLDFKVKLPGGSQSLCHIPRLGTLLWKYFMCNKFFFFLSTMLWFLTNACNCVTTSTIKRVTIYITPQNAQMLLC